MEDQVAFSDKLLSFRIGESVASISQTHAPMNEFRTHTCELKLLPANTERQFITHSFVNHINEDFMQAVIMDGEEKVSFLV